MKDQILEIIKTKPRHYGIIISRNVEMKSWVLSNSKLTPDSVWVEHIYSAVTGESNICSNGGTRKIVRINDGWTNCGPSASCECTKSQISNGVSCTKNNKTTEEKQATNNKRIQTMVAKYGVAYNSQRNEVKTVLKASKMKFYQHELLTDVEWLKKEYVDKKRTSVDIAQELGVHNSTVLAYCRQHGFEIRQVSNYSQQEVKVADYIRSLGFKVENNIRGILGNSEIDVFIPEKNIGIEVNGLLYHSYHPELMNRKQLAENKTRHLNKTLLATQQCIQLFHYTDRQINTQWDIVCSNISSKLGVHKTKIGARLCSVQEVNNSIAKKFFDQNHFQGHVPAERIFGLYFNNRLVQCISIGRHRYRGNGLEILRFATELHTTISGGLSKLLNHVRKTFPNNVINTYCDRDISNGAAYVKSGFEIIGYTDPGYFWTDGTEIISRYKSQKQRLKDWLPSYNPELSESENMFAAGFRRYWNSGNIILRLK